MLNFIILLILVMCLKYKPAPRILIERPKEQRIPRLEKNSIDQPQIRRIYSASFWDLSAEA